MAMLTEDEQRDLELARTINREARTIPESPYAGKWVAVLEGKVVAIADSLAEASAQLRAIEPDHERGILIEASADYETPVEIWLLK